MRIRRELLNACSRARSSERSTRSVETCAFFVTVVLALALPCFLYDLNLPDEPRVAHTSFEMLRTEDYVVPKVNAETFLHTPPCFYWLLALCFWLFGTEPEGVARLLPVACAAGTLLVTFFLTRRYAGWRAGVVSAAVLASTFHFWDLSHRVTVDMALTLFTNMALFSFATIVLEPRVRWWSGLLLGVFVGIAFLVKGVVGPGFLSLVAAVLFVRHRDLWTRRRVLVLVGSAATAAVVLLPWIGALYSRDPTYPSLAFGHVWERAVEGVAHNPSNWQFLHRLLLHAMPWTLLLPFVLYGEGRRAWGQAEARDGRGARFTELLLLMFLLPLIVLLISRGKRNLYLLPAMPAVAMLTGTWLESQLDPLRTRRIAMLLVWVSGLAGMAGLISTLLVAPANSSGLLIAALIAHLYWVVRWARRRARERRGVRPASERPVRWFEGPASAVYTALLLIVLCVAAWGSFYHVMRNPRYTAAPLGRRMVALESQGYEIAGYGLFQREFAAVAWYLRHPFPHVEEPEMLRALVEGGAEDRRFALVVEATKVEALTDGLSDWKEIYRTKLRRREVIVLVPP